ncbi:hypothetical protein ACR3K2_08550 [Cryptosporidium serpentis]
MDSSNTESKSYLECSIIGKADSENLEEIVSLLKSICQNLTPIKWCDSQWCPTSIINSYNLEEKLNFTKTQIDARPEAVLRQYLYPRELIDKVAIRCYAPIIESTEKQPNDKTLWIRKVNGNQNINMQNMKLNRVIECLVSPSFFEMLRFLNIGSYNSEPPTLYNTNFVSGYFGIMNTHENNEIIILMQSYFTDGNFNNKTSNKLIVEIKSRCLDINEINNNKQTILNTCKLLDKFVIF